jgi:hypothetical protein
MTLILVNFVPGVMDVDTCMARLAQTMSDNEPATTAVGTERYSIESFRYRVFILNINTFCCRAERSSDQTLQAEQDAAHLDSLTDDQEKI